MSEIQPSRPITQKDKEDLLAPVTEGLKDLVFGSPGLFDDRPGFIASPPSDNPFQNAVRAISQANCRTWAATDKGRYSTRVNTGNAALCGPYLDGLGEKPEDGEIAPPFTGGQCDLVVYQCLYRDDSVPNFTINSNFKTIGPIAGWRVANEEGRIRGFITSRGPITGSSCSVSAGSAGASSEKKVFDIADRGQTGGSFSVEGTCGGVPDNCGDPPPEIRPPSTVTPSTPLPPDFPVDVPGFGPVGVTVNPGPDGDIEVCIPELEFCIIVGPDEGAPAGGGEPEPTPSTGPNDNGPGDEGAIGGGSPPGDDGDFGEPPEGRAWIGVFVRFDVPPQVGNIPSANPDNPAYATVVGNVSLDHGTAFSAATQARSRWVGAFRENPNLTVKGCRVNSRSGVSFQVFPVSAETCPENQCKKPEEPVDG